jgi:7,8-dihydro-6-hydroxymethylpterin-pyrophosphokinase
MMARLLRIEWLLGRTRDVKDGPRTIDLDLVLYAEVQSHTEFLTLPHPRMHERRFVLEPLVEIAPRVMHPSLKCTASELLERLKDQSAVKRWCP